MTVRFEKPIDTFQDVINSERKIVAQYGITMVWRFRYVQYAAELKPHAYFGHGIQVW